MPKITFIAPAGSSHTVEASVGDSLMQTALKHSVAGIDADCGGGCACGTCHVYVRPDWLARLKPPDGMETSMLEFTIDRQATSRLSCQIPVTEELDGLVVTLPLRQH